MKKGKILQVGTPGELYMNPKSIFVAHFIGESNFLEGYVSSISGKTAMIELRGEVKVQAADKEGLEKGERVLLAIRPETFVIEKGKKEEENAISGKIERVTFEGTNVRYEVRLKNQDLVVIVKPSMTGEWFNTGEEVTISFPTEKAHVFKYPDVGLKEEIAIE